MCVEMIAMCPASNPDACLQVGITFLQSLMQICVEHIDFTLKEPDHCMKADDLIIFEGLTDCLWKLTAAHE